MSRSAVRGRVSGVVGMMPAMSLCIAEAGVEHVAFYAGRNHPVAGSAGGCGLEHRRPVAAASTQGCGEAGAEDRRRPMAAGGWGRSAECRSPRRHALDHQAAASTSTSEPLARRARVGRLV